METHQKNEELETGIRHRNQNQVIGKNTAQASGDRREEERNRILIEHLSQVRFLARHIHKRLPRGVPLEDLVHAGVVGLIDALDKFDASKNVQFSSYSKFRIQGAILDSLRDMDWGSRELRRHGRSIEQARNKLSLQLSRVPTETEIAAELGVSLRKVQQLMGDLLSLQVGSLNIESPWTGEEEDLCNYVPSASDDTPYYSCLRSEMSDLLAGLIAKLSQREQQVLALYYFEEMSMKRVGAVLGLGESRVSQIHSLVVTRLRARVEDLMSQSSTKHQTVDKADALPSDHIHEKLAQPWPLMLREHLAPPQATLGAGSVEAVPSSTRYGINSSSMKRPRPGKRAHDD